MPLGASLTALLLRGIPTTERQTMESTNITYKEQKNE